jgi:hypothetical protein
LVSANVCSLIKNDVFFERCKTFNSGIFEMGQDSLPRAARISSTQQKSPALQRGSSKKGFQKY